MRNPFRRRDPARDLVEKRIAWHRARIKDLSAGHIDGLTDDEAFDLITHHERELHIEETYLAEYFR
jgi:hypothetical protein